MSDKKYDLGIAFSGGGARGAAHCGAIQALNEFDVRPGIVSGTSVGAIVAVLYSAGISPKQMIDLFLGLDFFKDIVSPSVPRGGLFDSHPLVEYLRKIVPFRNLEDLPVPTYVIASDMEHGKVKVFTRGELATRVVASCSIPVIFNPMVIGGVHYVDGGAFQTMPVPAIRDKCRKVIGLTVTSVQPETYRDNLFYNASRSYDMMFVSNIISDSRLADIYLELDTAGCSCFDMSKLEELFRRGYDSTVAMLEDNGYHRAHAPEEITFAHKESHITELKDSFMQNQHRIGKELMSVMDHLRKSKH